ncbi:hypothetical protein ACF3MZ_28245 [Paenibacillaceae bacterium WGS1546]|uniref:hypothetical protein n=1 Tax=Cohnella sp. WGS1546 TaxID=3366810 RepID=UPI00372CF605
MNKQELQKKVRDTVHQLVWEKGYASPVDLFLKMGKVTPKQVEDWRFGRISYLERVLQGSLGKLSSIMKEFRKTGREMELTEQYQPIKSWGKGKKRTLRFSKSGDPNVERHYHTNFVKPRKPEPAKDNSILDENRKNDESLFATVPSEQP